jgi:phosphatidylglycerophosphatase A
MRFHTLPASIGFFSPVALIATFFGSGLIRPASGTWGSLAAFGVGLVVLAASVPAWVLGLMSVAVYCLGYWAALRWTASDDTDTDPSAIVIDEVAGMWLVMAFVPPTFAALAAAFFLFRLFDVLKPWPASWADQSLKGAHGIMLDDIFAGVWAVLVILAAQIYGFI